VDPPPPLDRPTLAQAAASPHDCSPPVSHANTALTEHVMGRVCFRMKSSQHQHVNCRHQRHSTNRHDAAIPPVCCMCREACPRGPPSACWRASDAHVHPTGRPIIIPTQRLSDAVPLTSIARAGHMVQLSRDNINDRHKAVVPIQREEAYAFATESTMRPSKLPDYACARQYFVVSN
jgi:hypothetical protein